MSTDTQKIKLNSELFKSVKNGDKRATTRLGYKSYNLEDKTYFVDPEGKEAPIEIRPFSVVHTCFGMLRSSFPDLPEHEGYDSWAEFTGVIESIYGEVLTNMPVTVLQFWYVP